MKITIVGTGYVGLVTGTCLAETGAFVNCVDIDTNKIENLKKGILPIYEPGLKSIFDRNRLKNRLSFETDLSKKVNESEIIFIAVGTPPDEDGSADLKYVLDVARQIGRHLNKYTVIVTKSTVPVGTARRVRQAITQELEKRKVSIAFDVASNPEFLKEGNAVDDFLKPDRIVIGTDSEKAKKILHRLYQPFVLNNHPIIFMDITSAEMTKYTANAMLATKISFINDIANLCEIVGADIDEVRRGISSDSRIGDKFLYPGVGYGGSCFPKDVQALIKTGEDYHHSLRILKAVEDINDDQKHRVFEKIDHYFDNNLLGKTIALWGLAFKPGTDDMREAPALTLIQDLLDNGVRIKAYDPIAMKEAERILGNKVMLVNDMYEATENADALVVVTEWNEFRLPDLDILSQSLNNQVIFDGRNIYNSEELSEAGFEHLKIGKQFVSKLTPEPKMAVI